MSAISLGADLSGQRCDAQVEVRSLLSDRLSHFRTSHEFTHYAEFTTAEEYCFLASWAAERRLPLLILANGSNVFFATKRVKTLVAKNRMPQLLHDLGGGRFEAASSVPLSKLLRCCERDGLDSFYYLASVPATVGGAVAMNAGRGIAHGKTVFDFVESVTYIEEGQFRTLPKDRIAVSYRSTPFAGVQSRLITSVVFAFPPRADAAGQAKERILWSKEQQDHSGPNCGSVFKFCSYRIMSGLRGLRIGRASFSSKTANWIINRGKHPAPLRLLIRVAQLLHFAVGTRAVLEIVRVK